MHILFFIPPLLILAYLTYRNVRYGIYIVLATVPAYLLRTTIWFIPTTWLELALYTVCGIMFYKHLKQTVLVPHFLYIMYHVRQYIMPIVLMLIAVCISILVTDNRARALGILKAWFVAPLLFSIVFLHYTNTKQTRMNALFSLTLSTWPIILYGIYEYLLGIGMKIPGRLDSFFSSPNYVAMYIVPIFVLLFSYLIIQEKHDMRLQSHVSAHSKGASLADALGNFFTKQMPYRLAYYIVWFMCALIAIALTKSFGGWLGLAGGLGFLFLFYPQFTYKRFAAILCIFVFIVVSLFYISNKTALSHRDRFWQMNSFQTRYEIWKSSSALLALHPIAGIGLADFKDDYASFVAALPIGNRPVEREVLFPHNVFLTFWLETGLLGFIAFVWIIVIFYHQTILRHKELASKLCVSPAAALAALLLHGLVDTPYFKNDLSLLFWIIIVLHALIMIPPTQSAFPLRDT